jgi:hypothetical protein
VDADFLYNNTSTKAAKHRDTIKYTPCCNKLVLSISHQMLESQSCVFALLSEGRETNVHSKIIFLTDAKGSR